MHPEVENAGARAPEPAAPPERAADGGGASAEAAAETEGAAWAEVLAGWDDEERHRAYLARFADLEGLAIAGGRYRDVLRERPGDGFALRFRDEVLRRATAQALASMPRTAPVTPRRRLLGWAVALVALALFFALVLHARDLLAVLGSRR